MKEDDNYERNIVSTMRVYAKTIVMIVIIDFAVQIKLKDRAVSEKSLNQRNNKKLRRRSQMKRGNINKRNYA